MHMVDAMIVFESSCLGSSRGGEGWLCSGEF